MIILLPHQLIHPILPIHDLNYNLAALPLTPTTPAHLHQHIIGPLLCPKIGKTDQTIGIHHPDKLHPLKIQPFRHHLSADQHIQISTLKIIDQSPELCLITYHIQVHPGNPGLRKILFHVFLDPFRTWGTIHVMSLPTILTHGRNCPQTPAIMTIQRVPIAIISHTHIAMLAFQDGTATVTL